jgi:hypothetical protein
MKNLILDIKEVKSRLGADPFFSSLSKTDIHEVYAQALDAIDFFGKNYDKPIFLVTELLKKKPTEQQRSVVHALFNFLFNALRDLFFEFVEVVDNIVPRIESFVLLNSVILVKLKKVS